MDGIIFDIDGTMWDSTSVVAKAWTEYLRETEKMDITITAEQLKSLFGQLLIDIARQLFPDLSCEEQVRIIDACCQKEHDALEKYGVPVYEGIEEMLDTLGRRYPLFIVSNCQAGYIELFLKVTGLSRYFKGHHCPGDTGLDKAGNISLIVKEFSLKEPAYVGDTIGDFNACRKAGVPFIFAAYGFGDVPEPDARIESPMDLIRLAV